MIRIVVHPQYGGYRRYPVRYGYPVHYGYPVRYGYGRRPHISLHIVGRPYGFRRFPFGRPPFGMPFGGPFAGPFGPMSPYGGLPIGPPPYGPYGPMPFGYPMPLVGAGMLGC